MKNTLEFQKKARLATQPIYEQVFSSPIQSLNFFLLTRLARVLRKPILWRAKTFWGGRLEGSFPDPVFSSIYLYGFLEEEVTRMLLKYLKPGKTFVDIGAHIGYFSLLASKILGDKGFVFSVEPTPRTYRLLSKNLSETKNCLTANYAAWSKTRILPFPDYGEFHSGLNSITEGRMTQGMLKRIKSKTIMVVAHRLDDYFSYFNIKPDFVKIDAESAEYDILTGMTSTLKAQRPILAIEIGDKPEQRGRTKRIIVFLKKRGYRVLEWTGGQFRPHRKLDNYINMYKNLLFLPG